MEVAPKERMKPKDRINFIRSVMKQAGEEVTLDSVNSELEKLGQKLIMSTDAFQYHWNKVFDQVRDEEVVKIECVNDSRLLKLVDQVLLDDGEESARVFIKIACLAEYAGLSKLRGYLYLLESGLRKIKRRGNG